MPGVFITLGIALLALLGGFFQLRLKPVLVSLGYGRVITSVGNEHCTFVPELQACEKLVIHQPSGVLYLACSNPISRKHWMPTVDRLNVSGKLDEDYVAVYNPVTSKITKLHVVGFDSPRGLSLHGMDVVPSESNPAELYIYLVNHRTPLGDKNAQEVGADSSIEIFKTTVGGSTFIHLNTIEDPTIIAPNDIVGSGDGKSFHFTNDHGTKRGFMRHLDPWLRRAVTSVGFCHVNRGCKFAIEHIPGSNGIAKSKEDQFYVANSLFGEIRVLERQANDDLVVTDIIRYDRPFDNLSVDEEGALWAAAFPNAIHFNTKNQENPTIPTPSSAIRITINTGESAFFGEKYKIDKMFEDDGRVASGSTSAAYDSQRNRLYLHGVSAPHLTICVL